jgi:protein gp37
MGVETGIAWTDSTFNPWWGCVKVSEACRDCYAEKWALRTGQKLWGPTARRRFFGEKHWTEPRKWDRAAAAEGKPWRVFCSSMADVFEELPEGHPDREAMAIARTRLWHLIAETPHLTWLLLTKRPENIARCYPWGRSSDGRMMLSTPANVWVGTTVESMETAAIRVPLLLEVPAVVRFLSVEPMLEELDFNATGIWHPSVHDIYLEGIDWVICGGESGGRARPFDLAWARSLRDQCKSAGVAFFMKQLGDNPVQQVARFSIDRGTVSRQLTYVAKAHHGADPAEWPEDLRRQEFPKARVA